MAAPVPRCPIRTGEPCTLCQINVTGPQDCGLVYLVMNDPDLRRGLAEQRRALSSRAGAGRADRADRSGGADPAEEADELGPDPRLEGLD